MDQGKEGCTSALIVTDGGLYKLGIADPIKEAFEKEGMKAVIYHDVVPNPTITNIEDGLRIYKETIATSLSLSAAVLPWTVQKASAHASCFPKIGTPA